MSQWQDRIIETREGDPAELVKMLHPDNPKSHPEGQMEGVEHSLKKVGWIDRPIWNQRTNYFLDGNGRVKLALMAGQASIKYDVVDLSPEEEQYVLLTFDPLGGMAEPDAVKLLALMNKVGEDLPEAVAEHLLGMVGEVEETTENGLGEELPPFVDKAEELQEKWQLKPGDLWTLPSETMPGKVHRLLCGDCRKAEDMARLVEGRKVNGVFTSPPYAEQRKQQYGGVPTAEYVEWWEAVQENVRGVLAEDGSFFVNIKEHCEDGQRVLYCKKLVIEMVERWGWRFVDELCWVRSSVPGNYSPRFKNSFEPVYHFSIGDCKCRPNNVLKPLEDASIKRVEHSKKSGEINQGRKHSKTGSGFNIDWKRYSLSMDSGALPSNTLKIPSEHLSTNHHHSAQFPTPLPTFFIRAYSDPGDLWLDPFAGSGTVIVAAETEERLGLGMEILPKYCAVVLERLSAHTNLDPVLLESA